jgi:type VI secretion system protein ImpH
VAATLGTKDPDLKQTGLRAELVSSPWNFDFFQALRILQSSFSGHARVGFFGAPSKEPVRLGVATTLSFPASEIQSLEELEGSRPVMRVNFLGLTGPLGVLPSSYTELVADRLRSRDQTLRDFLDIFHHRILSLFYRAWEKHHVAVEIERAEEGQFSRHVFQLIGLGTPGLQNRMAVPDAALLFYGGLLANRTRSAVGLEQILSDYFDVPVEIEQFVGAWEPVDAEFQSCLDDEPDRMGSLGAGLLIGDEVWEQQSRFCVRLGPLSYARYQDFLPGGKFLAELRSIVEFYTGPELEMVLQLILKREDAPSCELTPTEAQGVQLGWTTWLKTRPMDRDPGDTILDEALLRLN